jgi:hypothetical protein
MKRNFVVFCWIIFCNFLMAGEKFIVAVSDLSANGVSPVLAQNITNGIQARLSNYFTLISRADISGVIKEHQFQQAVTSDVVEIGKILGAQKMIFGTVNSVEHSEALNISIRMVDVVSGKIDIAESVDVLPRESLEQGLDLLSQIIALQIPVKGHIIQIQEKIVDIDLSRSDNIKSGAKFEIIQENEKGKFTAGVVEINDIGNYSSIGKIISKRTEIKIGDVIESFVDANQISKLRSRLEKLGEAERDNIMERIEQVAQLRRRKVEADIEEEKKRKIANLPINKFDFSVGHFLPTNRAFLDTFYRADDNSEKDRKFTLKEPVYQMSFFLGGHRYFRFYAEANYFRKTSRTLSDGSVIKRTIINPSGGIRVQFLISRKDELLIVPYGGLGIGYTFIIDNSDPAKQGMSNKLYAGGEFIIAEQIGIKFEYDWIYGKTKDDVDFSGRIMFIGVDVWF